MMRKWKSVGKLGTHWTSQDWCMVRVALGSKPERWHGFGPSRINPIADSRGRKRSWASAAAAMAAVDKEFKHDA